MRLSARKLLQISAICLIVAQTGETIGRVHTSRSQVKFTGPGQNDTSGYCTKPQSDFPLFPPTLRISGKSHDGHCNLRLSDMVVRVVCRWRKQ